MTNKIIIRVLTSGVLLCTLLALLAPTSSLKQLTQPRAAAVENSITTATTPKEAGAPTSKRQVIEHYGKLPLVFEANQGQTDAQVKFMSRGSGYNLYLTPTPAPILGNYAYTSVGLSGNTTITPSATPTDTASINVLTSTNFKGTFAADPGTGIVSVTDAHPAGIYTVTVTAFGSGGTTATTFQLTVTIGTACTGTAGFTNAPSVSVGTLPLSIAIGDFNNDGNQDIAVASPNTNAVSIRLGIYGGGPNVAVGGPPRSVAIGDFNGDGKQDFAAAIPGAVSIRLGDGLGSFTVAADVGVGVEPYAVAIGDFNNDGKLDIATPNSESGSVSIRLGDGLGGFTGSTEITVGSLPRAVVIGDFNNDGKQDFAAANNGSNDVSIRLGNGAGGFTSAADVSVGSNPFSVAIGDFNNDGFQDLAVANFSFGSSTVSIRIGDGTGLFTNANDVTAGTTGFFPVSVATADFNNDGKQDLAVANFGIDTVLIRFGDGAGGFTGLSDVGIGVGVDPFSVAIGDFNNDGKQDFVTADSLASEVSVRLGSCATATPTPTPTPATLILSSSRDSFLRSGNDDTNEGANDRLRIQNSGDNRVVVGFDLTGLSTVGLQSATLILNIAENSNNWGTSGRFVDAQRLLVDWTEGNGRNDVMAGGGPGFRGTGEGVTWHCGKDTNIVNQVANCSPLWNGGSFASATAPGALHSNGLLGQVSWSVTTDVLAGANFGWTIRKREENQNGQVRYYSREGAALAGNANLAPRLVLVYSF